MDSVVLRAREGRRAGIGRRIPEYRAGGREDHRRVAGAIPRVDCGWDRIFTGYFLVRA